MNFQYRVTLYDRMGFHDRRDFKTLQEALDWITQTVPFKAPEERIRVVLNPLD